MFQRDNLKCTIKKFLHIFLISNYNFRVRPGVAKHSSSISEKFAMTNLMLFHILCLLGQVLSCFIVRLSKKAILYEFYVRPRAWLVIKDVYLMIENFFSRKV